MCPNVEECEDKVRGRSLHCDQHTVISTLWREMETCLLNGKSFPKRCSTGDIIMAIVTSR